MYVCVCVSDCVGVGEAYTGPTPPMGEAHPGPNTLGQTWAQKDDASGRPQTDMFLVFNCLILCVQPKIDLKG